MESIRGWRVACRLGFRRRARFSQKATTAAKEGGFYNFWPVYTIDQGGFLWALAEHYLYARDKRFLDAVAKQMIEGCDFIIRERRRIMTEQAATPRPPSYGLAPAGCTADMRDWEYSFMLNGYFYLALKKCATALQDSG